MIADKVLGAYASIGGLSPAEQARWYRRLASEWGITTWEIPLLAGLPLSLEVVDALAEIPSSLVVTLVAQWARSGQKNRAYGLSSLDETARQAALLDAFSVLQQCLALSQHGLRIRNLVVHTGQRTGDPIPHAISFYQSLRELRVRLTSLLPDCTLLVEVTDSRPPEYAIPFPAAKKAALSLPELLQSVAAVNRDGQAGHPVSLMANWGRLLVNGDAPLGQIRRILASDVPLAGVILSGAGAGPDGFTDSHNSHLDGASGFTSADAAACASVLRQATGPVFIGTKCSRACVKGEVLTEEVLAAQGRLLKELV
ncbi:MAG: DUF4862 family protein [Planctomycetes bacterium]|nr:DUF4862 family protein [Planctomycetota bacterium]